MIADYSVRATSWCYTHTCRKVLHFSSCTSVHHLHISQLQVSHNAVREHVAHLQQHRPLIVSHLTHTCTAQGTCKSVNCSRMARSQDPYYQYLGGLLVFPSVCKSMHAPSWSHFVLASTPMLIFRQNREIRSNQASKLVCGVEHSALRARLAKSQRRKILRSIQIRCVSAPAI